MTLLAALLATRLFSNDKAGIIAGLFFALSAPPLYFEGQLLIATLFSFLLLILWFVIFQALENKPTKKSALLWALSGIVLGLAAQARPNALPLILFFPALAGLRFLKTKQLAKSSIPLLAIPGLLFIQVLFGAINAQYSGTFSLMTQAGGINFYLGNSLKADGMIPRQDRHVSYEGEYRDPIQVMAEQGYREGTGATGPVSPKEVSNHWKQKTIDEIKADPTRWIRLMAKKSWLMFWNHEVPNNRSFEFAATQDTPLLRWLPVRWWLLLALFPWGVAALLKKGKGEHVLWISSFFILFSGTVILFFVNSRFRIPLWPGMAVVAGGGAVYLWNSIQVRCIPKLPLIFSLILLPVSLINWFHIPPDPIENDLSMRAGAYYDQGRYDEALADAFQCLEFAPNNPRYHFLLGNILLAKEEYTTAVNAYLKAISLNAEDPMFHNNLGIAFEGLEDYEKADIAYRKALELRPNHRAARTNLMLLSIRTGKLEHADRMLTELLSEDPENPTLLSAQAVLLYNETGNLKALEHARQLNPALVEQLVDTE
jgi:thioredoxin-like negative regulator of GroEL